MSGLDWAAILRAGIHGLGLRPAEVWTLTPAELLIMLDAGGPRPLDRGGLDALMARFPDAPGPGAGEPGSAAAAQDDFEED